MYYYYYFVGLRRFATLRRVYIICILSAHVACRLWRVVLPLILQENPLPPSVSTREICIIQFVPPRVPVCVSACGFCLHLLLFCLLASLFVCCLLVSLVSAVAKGLGENVSRNVYVCVSKCVCVSLGSLICVLILVIFCAVMD